MSKILITHRGSGFDFDAEKSTSVILNEKIDFPLVLVTILRDLIGPVEFRLCNKLMIDPCLDQLSIALRIFKDILLIPSQN